MNLKLCPLPWKFNVHPQHSQEASITAANGAFVMAGPVELIGFIVRAVNSHEVMLAALKNMRPNIAALPEIIERGGCLVGDKEAVESMKVWADEAITKAEGK